MSKSAVAVLTITLLLTACQKEEEYEFKDGNYRAETAEFSFGRKAFLEAEIQEDKAVSVDFDYLDEEGNLKSATTDEEYPMTPHPREWLPELENQLLALDILNVAEIDGVTGATGSSGNAYDLFLLILEAAETGDTSTQVLSSK